MSKNPSTPDNNAPKKKAPAPPDERFWKRYSPHHEFPLSLSSSVFLHVIALVILIFGGVLLAIIGLAPKEAIAVDTITIAGGGGNPDGYGNQRGEGIISGPEAVEKDKPPEKIAKTVPNEKLQNPEDTPPPLVETPSKDNTRYVEKDAQAIGSAAANVQSKAKEKLAAHMAGKGQGGVGSGGGKGSGTGTGEGGLEGPGKANITKRDKRRARWTMLFNVSGGGGRDYVRQLNGLGAILAYPTAGDNYMVIRNLSERPVRPVAEDIRQFNMIWWQDDKPESVDSLARALGISPAPEYFVAFFPLALEQQLLDKELKAFRGKEEDIEETVFRVQPRGGGYEPEVAPGYPLARGQKRRQP